MRTRTLFAALLLALSAAPTLAKDEALTKAIAASHRSENFVDLVVRDRLMREKRAMPGDERVEAHRMIVQVASTKRNGGLYAIGGLLQRSCVAGQPPMNEWMEQQTNQNRQGVPGRFFRLS